MANTKISQLPQNNSPTGSEELVYAFNNSNGKMTLNTMTSFAQTGMQPALISGTTIKTINGEDILGAGNLVISGGGGGGSTGTVALNALENITAGTLCSFTGAGVKKLRRGFYGTADSGISLTVGQNQYTMIDSVAVTSDTTVVVYTDGNDDGYVVAIKRDGETRTVGTPVSLGADVRFPRISSPYTGEFVIAYGDYANSGAVSTIAGNVSGTTITIGSKVQLLGAAPAQSGVGITRRSDNDLREFVVFYIKDSDKKIYYKICSYTSGLVITGGTEGAYFTSTTDSGNLGVDYLGGGAVAVVYDCVSGGTYYIYAGYSNAASSSISSSARIALYTGSATGDLGFTPRSVKVTNSIFLVDTGTNAAGLCLIGTYGIGRSLYIIQELDYNISPVTGRSYCSEDVDSGIIGMFGINQTDGIYNIVYNRYRGSDTGLEFIDSVVLGTGSFYDEPTVVRIGETSCCSWLNYTDGKMQNLLFQDESNHFVGINQEAATSGNSVDITYSGVVDTTGLSAGSEIYVGLDGAAATSGSKLIGLALSSTQALLK